MAMTLVAKALVKAARAIMKIKGMKGLIGMSPEGVKKATGIISSSGKRSMIQELISRSPSKVSVSAIEDILQGGSKLSEAALKTKK